MSTAARRCGFDQLAACAVWPSIAAAMVILRTCPCLNCLQFAAFGDLRREMSTKSNNNGAAVRRGLGTDVASDNRFVKRAQMELAYFSFYARIKQRQTGGAGVVLRFQRVRPGRLARFQPHKPHEITPRFLDRTIR